MEDRVSFFINIPILELLKPLYGSYTKYLPKKPIYRIPKGTLRGRTARKTEATVMFTWRTIETFFFCDETDFYQNHIT